MRLPPSIESIPCLWETPPTGHDLAGSRRKIAGRQPAQNCWPAAGAKLYLVPGSRLDKGGFVFYTPAGTASSRGFYTNKTESREPSLACFCGHECALHELSFAECCLTVSNFSFS
jgi:hypothetical protein